jgi:hypothetical protein
MARSAAAQLDGHVAGDLAQRVAHLLERTRMRRAHAHAQRERARDAGSAFVAIERGADVAQLEEAQARPPVGVARELERAGAVVEEMALLVVWIHDLERGVQ